MFFTVSWNHQYTTCKHDGRRSTDATTKRDCRNEWPRENAHHRGTARPTAGNREPPRRRSNSRPTRQQRTAPPIRNATPRQTTSPTTATLLQKYDGDADALGGCERRRTASPSLFFVFFLFPCFFQLGFQFFFFLI